MPGHPENRPFPFPNGYETNLKKKLRAESIKDYVAIFRNRRNERPGGRFAPADVQEMFRLAEDLGYVDVTEIDYLRSLARDHPVLFRPEGNEEQKRAVQAFADTHERLNEARKDPLIEDILKVVPLDLFRQQPVGRNFVKKAEALGEALRRSDAHYARHAVYDDELVAEVNERAAELGEIVEGFTLTDIDEPGRSARLVYIRDLRNFLRRLGGDATDHEAEFRDGRWVNWNRDVEVYPERYVEARNLQELKDQLREDGPLRMVAGGHAFNVASSMGGIKSDPLGTLVTLDRYLLESGNTWERVPEATARAEYQLSEDAAKRVVRVSAGMRLRDFGKAMNEAGMSLPVAGSTDAQSLGGLIATDLHSTGRVAGFLSQQVLEVKALTSDGNVLTFTKDESVPRGAPGRWRYDSPRLGAGQKLRRLPVSGAIGTAGIVFEVVLKLDAAFRMEKSSLLVPRVWAESSIERLLDPAEQDPLLSFDHVSFYYPGGGGKNLPTVRINTWKRTEKPVLKGSSEIKTLRELFDHVGSAFLPEYLLDLGRRSVNAPGVAPGPNDDEWLLTLNRRRPEVLPAHQAFARKLFFQHDEIEVGIPLPHAGGKPDYQVFRDAIADTQELLAAEEFPTIIEIRFTPDVSEGILGPGAGSPTCYIELATPLGRFSRARIVQVYLRFDRMLREKYGARPHLGKKTTATFEDMEKLYGEDWVEFQRVRKDADPSGKFLPEKNTLLAQIFQPAR